MIRHVDKVLNFDNMLIFLLTFFISFVGSIHPGPLNLSVIQTTLQKGIYQALLLTFGGIIPEIIYGYLAVEGIMIFEKYPVIFNVMQWAVVPILLFLGIQQIIASRKPKPIIKTRVDASSNAVQGVLRGFTLSITNPQLLPYWIIILINYQNYKFLKINELSDKLLFVLGASLGAFALNYVYAYVAHKQRERIFKYLNESHFEQLIGYTFVLIGLLQGIKMLF
jgi:threonine/homoserine/homoserine lactone efflux protein